jgi:hypothetical protein
MSICKVEKIEVLRGYRYMLTTAEGVILTTPPSTSVNRDRLPAAGIKGAIAAMTGPFWAAVELDAEGYIATLEGVEF